MNIMLGDVEGCEGCLYLIPRKLNGNKCLRMEVYIHVFLISPLDAVTLRPL